MELSVLQSVYYKDDPIAFDLSLESLFKQTLRAKQVVIVKDGKISNDLQCVIDKWKKNLPIMEVGYDLNRGLSYALNYGLKYVENEYVARMDSDDICYPDRFEKQVDYLTKNPDCVLLSGYISEFYKDIEKIVDIRKVPVEYEDIKKSIVLKNTFNHMAVVFKKQVIEIVGGYQEVPYFEDWDLWVRVVNNNYVVSNIPVCLVYARIGNDMIGRRHGIQYVKKEIFFHKRQLKAGYITLIQFIKAVIVRVPIRLLPKPLLKKIYSLSRR